MKDTIGDFYNIEEWTKHSIKYKELQGPKGYLLFVACDAGKQLANDVKREYELILAKKYAVENTINMHSALRGSEEGRQFLEEKIKNTLRNNKELDKMMKERVIPIPIMEDITNKFERKGKDGTCPRLKHNISGADAFLFQNCMDYRKDSLSLNENLMQLIEIAYTLKDYEASRITVIVPYFPYSRQDGPSFMEREPVLAQTVASIFEKITKVDSVYTYHPHSTKIKGFFGLETHFKFISGVDLFLDIFSNYQNDKETVAISTDGGGSKVIKYFAKSLNLSYCTGLKDRSEQNKIEVEGFQGSFKGEKRAIILEDESATFRSCFGRIKQIYEEGIKEILLGVSHMRTDCTNKEYIDRMIEAHEKYGLKEIHTTDSVPQSEEFTKLPFVKVHSLAKMWAFVINRVHYDISVSKLFKGQYNEDVQSKI